MRQKTSVILILALVSLLSLLILGQMSTNSVGSTSSTSIAGQSTQQDLTNSNSPQAASFNGIQSITKLAPSPTDLESGAGLKLVAQGLTAPMLITSPDDWTGRLFVVEQTGTVRILFANGTMLDQPFLDVSGKIVRLSPGYDERGLLGLAFHPDFKQNGLLYIYYSMPLREGAPFGWSCTNRLSRFNVSRSDRNIVDMSSEKVLLEIDKPYSNHNGGQIRFGPDGYLYLPTGDGGGADDTGLGHTPVIGNAQDLTKLLGKILRIDVNHPGNGKPYGVPQDNPFLGNKSWQPEIYAYGLRNPAFAAFDSKSGRLFAATAGQQLFEGVDVILKGGNYGWNIREGTHCFDPDNPGQPPASCRTTGYMGEPLIGPIVELGHDLGSVIIGGYVYRGSAVPALQGRYVFADWSSNQPPDNGTLLVAMPPSGWNWNMSSNSGDLTASENGMWTTSVLRAATGPDGRINAYIRGFGEDENHELYVLTSQNGGPSGNTAKIYEIVPA